MSIITICFFIFIGLFAFLGVFFVYILCKSCIYNRIIHSPIYNEMASDDFTRV